MWSTVESQNNLVNQVSFITLTVIQGRQSHALAAQLVETSLPILWTKLNKVRPAKIIL